LKIRYSKLTNYFLFFELTAALAWQKKVKTMHLKMNRCASARLFLFFTAKGRVH
jgi:hypothetical protein